MSLLRGPFRSGAMLLLLSAALHILAFTVGGLTPDALILIPIGILYIAVAAGLARGWRWLAWISFFGLFVGSIGALSNVWGSGPVPGWWYATISAVDGFGVVAFFLALWQSPHDPEVSS